jgi:phosphoesterase RecJ-like protein
VPLEKLKLIARAIEKIEIFCDGAIAATYISADDYAELGASEELTEGVIDYVRSIEGIRVAAAIRDTADGRAARKASLRSADGTIDVSEIARDQGGGGHTRAAGFSTDMTYAEVIDYVCGAVKSQL